MLLLYSNITLQCWIKKPLQLSSFSIIKQVPWVFRIPLIKILEWPLLPMAFMQFATEARDNCSNSFYWLMHRLAIVTLSTVGVEPPVYSLCLVHPFPASIVFLAMCTQGDSISSCKFYLDFLRFFSESNFGKLYIIGFLKAYSLLQ